MNKQRYVYFLRSRSHFKIGSSVNPGLRFEMLNRSYGPLTYLGCIPGTFADERRFRKIIGGGAEALKGSREWFKITNSALAQIKRLPLRIVPKNRDLIGVIMALDVKIHKKIKMLAARTGVTVREAAEELLNYALKARKEAA